MASCYMSHSSAAEPRLGSLPQAGTPSSAARGRGVVGVTGHRPVDADLSWLTGRRRQVTIQVGAFRSVTTHPHVVSTVSLTRIEGNLLGWIMAIMARLKLGHISNTLKAARRMWEVGEEVEDFLFLRHPHLISTLPISCKFRSCLSYTQKERRLLSNPTPVGQESYTCVCVGMPSFSEYVRLIESF